MPADGRRDLTRRLKG